MYRYGAHHAKIDEPLFSVDLSYLIEWQEPRIDLRDVSNVTLCRWMVSETISFSLWTDRRGPRITFKRLKRKEFWLIKRLNEK